MRKTAHALTISTAFILGLAGWVICGSGCNGPEDATDGMHSDGQKAERPMTIMVIPQDPEDKEEQSAKLGAEKAAADLGKSSGLKVNVLWSPPASAGLEAQKQTLSKAATLGANAVLLDCVDASGLNKTIDELSPKVPVMTYGNDAPQSSRFSFYGVDSYEAGQRLVRELSRQMKGQGKVAVLAGSEAEADSKRATEGVTVELSKNPGFNLVGVFHCDENPRSAMDEVRKQATAHKDIQAWVMVGPWALEEQSFMKVLDPTDTRIVALGCLPSELWYVNKGATLYAKASYQMAYVGVQTIIQKLGAGQPVPKTVKFDLNAARVARENVRTWAKSLDTWGFQDVPPEFLWGTGQTPSRGRAEGVK